MRMRCTHEQQEHGCSGGQQYPLEDPETQDGDEHDGSGVEIDPADPPDAEHRREIDRFADRGQDDGGKDRFRKLARHR